MSRRVCLISFLIIISINFAIFFMVARFSNQESLQIFTHLDSEIYSHISLHGYDRVHITVFYPLYPLLIKIISLGYFNSVIVGTIFSFLIYIFVVINWIKQIPSNKSTTFEGKNFFLAPQNQFGLLLFIVAPCNYIFLTNHTESLFLLISFLSFSYVYKMKYFKAAFLVGLAMLTKNQGIFVFLLAFVILIDQNLSDLKILIKKLILFSFIVFLIYINWPLYLWGKFNDPISFYHQQSSWHKVTSVSEYLKTFIFANPWQNLRVNSILHECWFMVFFVSAILALFKKYYKIALYTLLIMVIIPAQGELVNDYRYTIISYPTYFFIGKYLEDRYGSKVYFLLIPLSVLSFSLTYAYAILRWAY